jgi:hypothetical protein
MGTMNSTRLHAVRSLACRVAGLGLLLGLLAGCQGTGSMSGKVKFQGKPLVYGTVLLIGSDNKSVQAPIQKDGQYDASGLAPGEIKVAVNSPNPKGVGRFTGWRDEKKKPPPFEVPGWFEIPGKYGDVKTSGLTYTIQGGSNPIDIELK